jgi:hypothetical protein
MKVFPLQHQPLKEIERSGTGTKMGSSRVHGSGGIVIAGG